MGGQGVWTPAEKSQKYRVSMQYCLDPIKITKLPSQHLILGYHQPARETPFKWCFAGGQMMAHL